MKVPIKENDILAISDSDIINDESSLAKLIYIILIYIFYIFGGILNEKLTKSKYEYKSTNNTIEAFKFKDPLIILCTLSSFSLIISLYMSKKMKNKLFKNSTINPISFYDQSIIGILHTASTFTSQLSLLYVDFIVKTIGKSCKSASFLFLFFLNSIPFCNKIFKKILNNKINEKENETSSGKIQIKDLIKVIITTISVILFNLSSNKKNKSDDSSSRSTIGIIILLISLFFDGLLSLKEKMIQININDNLEYKGYEQIICWEYMKIFGSHLYLVFLKYYLKLYLETIFRYLKLLLVVKV